MPFGQIETFDRDGATLAFERQLGAAPTFVWLSGFRSDMAGTKAQALAAWAHGRGQGFVRFDYFGHGRSSGDFADGTISRWLGDALAVIDDLSSGPLVLIGSSMGGWLALLAARARPGRVKGLLLIAPAADFTERLMWPSFSVAQKQEMEATGRIEIPSAYAPEPTIITRAMLEDGKRHVIMDRPFAFDGPVHVLQGGQDPDVPASHAGTMAALVSPGPVRFELIDDGDHRLSRPQDIERLIAAADGLATALAR